MKAHPNPIVYGASVGTQFRNTVELTNFLLSMAVGTTILLDFAASDHLRAWTRQAAILTDVQPELTYTVEKTLLYARMITTFGIEGTRVAAITRLEDGWQVQDSTALPNDWLNGTEDGIFTVAGLIDPTTKIEAEVSGAVVFPGDTLHAPLTQCNPTPVLMVLRGVITLGWLIAIPSGKTLMDVAFQLELVGAATAHICTAKYAGPMTANGLRWLSNKMYRNSIQDIRGLRRAGAFSISKDSAIHGYHAPGTLPRDGVGMFAK